MNAALTFLVLSGQPDPLWETLCRFPPHQVAAANLEAARKHYAYLDGMHALIGPDHYLAGADSLPGPLPCGPLATGPQVDATGWPGAVRRRPAQPVEHHRGGQHHSPGRAVRDRPGVVRHCTRAD